MNECFKEEYRKLGLRFKEVTNSISYPFSINIPLNIFIGCVLFEGGFRLEDMIKSVEI